MANRQWLEQLKRQLAEKRLPSTYIQRFMEELSDHFEDLTEDTMRNEEDCVAQLGEPAQVADAAVVAYRQRTVFGRHPVMKYLVFGISPSAAIILAFTLVLWGFMACTELCETLGMGEPLSSFFHSFDASALEWAAAIVTLMLPTMLLAIFYCRWARRSELGKKWIWISCSILAIIAVLPIYQVTMSDIPGESALRVVAGIGTGMIPHTVLQYTQMLVPLAVGLWYLRRARDPQPTDQEESLRAAA